VPIPWSTDCAIWAKTSARRKSCSPRPGKLAGSSARRPRPPRAEPSPREGASPSAIAPTP
jgi:hypothetical protein